MKREDAAPFFPMLRGMAAAFAARLAGEFEEAEIRAMLARADEPFRDTIPSIPEVGADNPWLKSLIGVAWLSDLWLRLEERGWDLARISLTTQKVLSDFAQASLPKEKRAAIGAAMCSPELAQKIAALAGAALSGRLACRSRPAAERRPVRRRLRRVQVPRRPVP